MCGRPQLPGALELGRHRVAAGVTLTLAAVIGARADNSFLEPYDCKDGLASWETKWPVDKKTWCCAEKSVGCVPTHPYDCTAGFDTWQESWSYGQKVWCCQNRGKGCPQQANVPQAAAPLGKALAAAKTPAAPAPFPVTPPPMSPAAAGAAMSCGTPCVVDGVSHTCGERVLWSATHTFKGKAGACALAMDLVLGQCPHCSSCNLNDVGCAIAPAAPAVASTTRPPRPLALRASTTEDPLALLTDDPLAPSTDRSSYSLAGAAHTRPLDDQLPAEQAQNSAKVEHLENQLKQEKAEWELKEERKELELERKAAKLERQEAEFKEREEEMRHKEEEIQDAVAEQQWAAKQQGSGGDDSSSSSSSSSSETGGSSSSGSEELASSPSPAHTSAPKAPAPATASATHATASASAVGGSFTCSAGTLESMKGWSEEHKAWCCQHEDRACDLMEVNSEPKKTQNSARPYRCEGADAEPVSKWSDVKREWCCQVNEIGCKETKETDSSSKEEAKSEEEAEKKPKGGGPFDGSWTDKRGNSLVISKKEITWPSTDRSAKITKQSSKGITMAFAGGEYHAKYLDGKLVWDVDDVWKRSGGGSSEESSSSPKHATAAKDSSHNKVRSVLSTIDRNNDGHLNYTEITYLQQAAHVGHIEEATYKQLCKEFGEDPSVGLGVETLTSIYAKTGKLPSGDKSAGAGTVAKFLSGRALLTGSGAVAPAVLFACGLAVAAVAASATCLAKRASSASRARSRGQPVAPSESFDDDDEDQGGFEARASYMSLPRAGEATP